MDMRSKGLGRTHASSLDSYCQWAADTNRFRTVKEKISQEKPHMARIIKDLKYGLHLLRKSPGFTPTAVLVLALDIRANTAILNLVNTAFLLPLHLEDPGHLQRE